MNNLFFKFFQAGEKISMAIVEAREALNSRLAATWLLGWLAFGDLSENFAIRQKLDFVSLQTNFFHASNSLQQQMYSSNMAKKAALSEENLNALLN